MIKVLMATYHRPKLLAKTLNSLQEEIDKIRKADYGRFQLFIFDNNSGEEVRGMLLAFQNKNEEVAVLSLSDTNIGKAKALNSFLPNIEDDDIVCSFDSDLVIENSLSGKFFGDGAALFTDKFLKHHPASVIVPDQVGNGQHLIEKNWSQTAPPTKFSSPFEDAYVESEFGFHVAGGCLFTRGSTFKGVGGYRENRGLFGGNDGFFLLDASRFCHLPIYVMRYLIVYHPPDEDAGYAEWKKKAQDQQRAFQRCLSYKGYYES